MNYSPCILIPIYNHKDNICRTVERLRSHGLPIIIVDDGSDTATQAVLGELAANVPGLRLFRLAENSGKGAAVMLGMRKASELGYTHALQIDADGQHDINDVSKFISASMAHPEVVVCGKPVYDSSVPKGRLYGRYITHFWVWVETLSFDIGDSMCGFRLYPLRSTCELIDAVSIPKRMDFDIAIVVHLAWRGLRFINIPTRVTYPADGVSHFDVLRDNVRITRMHTGLFFGMLPRLPMLLKRRLVRSSAQ